MSLRVSVACILIGAHRFGLLVHLIFTLPTICSSLNLRSHACMHMHVVVVVWWPRQGIPFSDFAQRYIKRKCLRECIEKRNRARKKGGKYFMRPLNDFLVPLARNDMSPTTCHAVLPILLRRVSTYTLIYLYTQAYLHQYITWFISAIEWLAQTLHRTNFILSNGIAVLNFHHLYFMYKNISHRFKTNFCKVFQVCNVHA